MCILFLSSLLFVSWTNYIFLFLSFSESHTVPLSWYHTQAHFFSLFPQCVLLFYAHIVSLSFSKSSIILLCPFLSLFLSLSLSFYVCLSFSNTWILRTSANLYQRRSPGISTSWQKSFACVLWWKKLISVLSDAESTNQPLLSLSLTAPLANFFH